MKHLKSYKIFESAIEDLENYVQDILRDLEDNGLQVEISRIRKDVDIDTERYFNRTSYWQKRADVYLEVYIRRPLGAENRENHLGVPGAANPKGGYPGNLFFWYEIKDTIIRLTEWYYSQAPYDPIDKETIYRTDKDNSPLRFFASGIEFLTGCSKEEDFNGIGDYISFTNFRLMIKL
jgi:hypothetical protein